MLRRLKRYSRQWQRLGARRREIHKRRPLVDGLERRELLSTVSVSGQANIYGAGLTVPPDPGGGGGGILPVKINLSALGSPRMVDFPTVTGTVSGWAAAGGYNGPDGGGYWGGVTNVPAHGGISGIEDDKATMFLVGVFLGPDGQPASPPPTLNVTSANSVESFSPLVGQQFFIGDGHTSAYALQKFVVPAGATSLFLGFAENYQFAYPSRPPGYYGDNGGTLTVDVEAASPLPTQTALTTSVTSVPLGQPVTLTTTVSDLSTGGATPNGGTVTFNDEYGALGSATLVDGVAVLITSSLPAGTNTITASYGGTSDFSASTSGATTVVVTKTPVGPVGTPRRTQMVLRAQPSPAPFARPVRLAATVQNRTRHGGTPGGFVTFFDGMANLGTVALSRGTAIVTTTILHTGANKIEAVYTPSTGFLGCTKFIVEHVKVPRIVRTAMRSSMSTAVASPRSSAPIHLLAHDGFKNRLRD